MPVDIIVYAQNLINRAVCLNTPSPSILAIVGNTQSASNLNYVIIGLVVVVVVLLIITLGGNKK